MYYKVNKALSAKIIKVINDAKKERAQWQKYAESLGAKGFFLGRGWFATSVEGFDFDNKEPNKKEYYRHKQNAICWVPRAGTEMRKEMQRMKQDVTGDICDLLGFERWGGNGHIYTPGVTIKDGYAYIDVHDDAEQPKSGAKRISDLTYEKLMAKKKVKK